MLKPKLPLRNGDGKDEDIVPIFIDMDPPENRALMDLALAPSPDIVGLSCADGEEPGDLSSPLGFDGPFPMTSQNLDRRQAAVSPANWNGDPILE